MLLKYDLFKHYYLILWILNLPILYIKSIDFALYSQRWIEQPIAARGKERRKERGKEGLKINLKIIIILILTVNSDKNRI